MTQELQFDVLPSDQVSLSRQPVSLSSEQLAILQRLEVFARVLDAAIRIPGINLRLGADSILGLVVPGVGDALTAVASGYVVFQGSKLGVPPHKLARMITNILVDTGIGAIPFAGDILDIVLKKNLKNVNIIRDHFDLPPLLRK